MPKIKRHHDLRDLGRFPEFMPARAPKQKKSMKQRVFDKFAGPTLKKMLNK